MIESGERCVDADVLIAFGERRLDDAARATVRQHLLACATCRQGFAATQDMSSKETIGRFVIVERIGAGATGVVYAARDPELDRRVALKILRTDRWTPEASRKRLIREARMLAKVGHPNVVTIYDAGSVGDDIFIAMELVDGQPLHVWCRDQQPGAPQIVDVFRQAALGLAAAHAVGVIHRDFKPANVLLGNDGRVRVVDFGLARTEADAKADDRDETTTEASSTDLSRSGMFIGTPAYMSPEQLRGEVAGTASDQYAFCVALTEALAGARTVPPQIGACPRWIQPVLARGLAADPAQRFPSIHALASELVAAPRRRQRRRRGAVIGTSAALVSGGLAFAFLSITRQPPLCGNPQEQLHQIWPSSTRNAISVKFVGPAMVPLFEALDRYADEWTVMRASACTATRIDGAQSELVMDLRMQCLDQRRTEFRQLTDALLGSTDPRLIHTSVTAVHQLVSVETCADTRALAEAVPPPSDPELRASVDRVREQLARAMALAATGEYATSLRVAEDAANQAERLAYRPLLGQAQYALGLARQRMGKAGDAERAFRTAIDAAAAARDDLLAARAWLHLIEIVAADRSRAQEIKTLADFARTATVRAGNHVEEQEVLLAILSDTAYDAGREREALDHAERRLALVDKPTVDPLLLISALDGMATLLSKMGRADDSMRHAERALPLARRYLGETHPTLASLWVRIGNVHYHHHRLDQAEQAYQQALAVWTASIGVDTPMLATLYTSLGACHAARGRYSEAQRALTRALAIAKVTNGEQHQEVATIINDLAILQLRQGKHREGVVLLEQALATWRAILPAHDPTLIGLLINLGLASGNLEEHATAERYCREALAEIEASKRAAPNLLIPVLNCIGNELEKSGRPGPARPFLERALALDPEHPMLRAEIEFGLARTLLAPPVQLARAGSLARGAHAAFLSGGEPTADSAREVATWLTTHGFGAR